MQLNDTRLVSARISATDAAHRLFVAYWADDERKLEYHFAAAKAALAECADALGFALVPVVPAAAEDDRLDGLIKAVL